MATNDAMALLLEVIIPEHLTCWTIKLNHNNRPEYTNGSLVYIHVHCISGYTHSSNDSCFLQ